MLPAWVARQRKLQREGSLSDKRRTALEGLDFEFDPRAARWEARLSEYAAATTTTKNRKQQSQPKLSEPLRSWAARQRKAHAEGKLAPERVEALHQLKGWSWTPPLQRGPTALQRLGRRLPEQLPQQLHRRVLLEQHPRLVETLG